MKIFFTGLLIFISRFALASDLINCPSKAPLLRDLYEATNQYQLQLQGQQSDLAATITMISKKLGPLMYLSYQQVNNVILQVTKHVKFVDLQSPAEPYASCMKSEISRRENDDILIDLQSWNSIDLLNQAALLFNEGFAYQNRNIDRKLISFLFSTEDMTPVQAGLPNNNKLCYTKGANSNLLFYAFPDKANPKIGTWFQFWSFGGYAHFTQSKIFFPEFPFKLMSPTGNLQESYRTPIHFTESKVYGGIPISFEWKIIPGQKKFFLHYEIDGSLQTVTFECE